MEFPLYTDVILVQDVPKEGLHAGYVGVVVERHDVVGREPRYSVEFFDILGNTIAVATVLANALHAPTPADRPTVRSAQADA